LRLAVVADGMPDLLDAGGECGLRDEPTAPDGVEELFLGHHPFTMRDEVCQDVEHLRFDVDHPLTPPQLVRLGVDDGAREPVPHRGKV
jgi:hypothetical protein